MDSKNAFTSWVMGLVGTAGLAGLLLVAPESRADESDARASEPSVSEPTPPVDSKAAARERTADKERSALAVYLPPSRGRAIARSGAGTRGAALLPRVSVLTPTHEGFTTVAQPNLYWHISGPTDVRVDFTLIDEASVDPLAEITLDGPVSGGYRVVRLADLGLELVPNKSYRWHISIVPDTDRRWNDVIDFAGIRRVAVSDELRAALAEGQPAYAAYASAGIWYDALSALDAALNADPTNARLFAQREAFLDQVDLALEGPGDGELTVADAPASAPRATPAVGTRGGEAAAPK